MSHLCQGFESIALYQLLCSGCGGRGSHSWSIKAVLAAESCPAILPRGGPSTPQPVRSKPVVLGFFALPESFLHLLWYLVLSWQIENSTLPKPGLFYFQSPKQQQVTLHFMFLQEMASWMPSARIFLLCSKTTRFGRNRFGLSAYHSPVPRALMQAKCPEPQNIRSFGHVWVAGRSSNHWLFRLLISGPHGTFPEPAT